MYNYSNTKIGTESLSLHIYITTSPALNAKKESESYQYVYIQGVNNEIMKKLWLLMVKFYDCMGTNIKIYVCMNNKRKSATNIHAKVTLKDPTRFNQFCIRR